MTTYRLFPATNGPASPAAFAGNFLCGVLFKVTQGGMFLNGYYHWVPTGGDTVARKFCLWAIKGAASGTLISAATVTSGTLTANTWNFVQLATPVPLAIGTAYCACTGWVAVNGFPDSDTAGSGTGPPDSYGTGGHTAGITQGPLFAFSDGAGGGGTAPEPYGTAQGVFSSTLGSDPAVNMPNQGSNSANFWMDVQVDTVTPVAYSGTYRLYPNKVDANQPTVPDNAVNYVVATEVRLSVRCQVSKIWYYSPVGTAQRATSCRVWSVLGPNSGTSVVTNLSPAWSGAAGSGWISCSFTSTFLPAGTYKVSVFNGAGTPDQWSAKDASSAYWGTGDGVNGITWGPLTAPGLSAPASLAYKYLGSGGANSPPFSDGLGTTEPGQCTFVNATGDLYPYLYVDALAQNYWLDLEVTPAPLTAVPIPADQATASGGGAYPALWGMFPVQRNPGLAMARQIPIAKRRQHATDET